MRATLPSRPSRSCSKLACAPPHSHTPRTPSSPHPTARRRGVCMCARVRLCACGCAYVCACACTCACARVGHVMHVSLHVCVCALSHACTCALRLCWCWPVAGARGMSPPRRWPSATCAQCDSMQRPRHAAAAAAPSCQRTAPHVPPQRRVPSAVTDAGAATACWCARHGRAVATRTAHAWPPTVRRLWPSRSRESTAGRGSRTCNALRSSLAEVPPPPLPRTHARSARTAEASACSGSR